MPQGPGSFRKLTPLKKGQTTLFRYLTHQAKTWGQPVQNKSGINWASCQNYYQSGFRDTPFAQPSNGFYLSRGDLALLGLTGVALAPAAFAFTGVASAFWVIGGGVMTNVSMIGGIGGAGLLSGLAGFIKPKGATFTDFGKPCSEEAGKKF